MSLVADPTAFAALVARARACRRCPAMEGCRRVLGPANGSLASDVLFVAEAPGRLGAARSGVPLSGDQSGRNFEALLVAAGLCRADVFVTNAVLCNPRDTHGRNRPPRVTELRNCREHLALTISIVAPRVVVALGAVALTALGALAPHDAVLARDAGRPLVWDSRWLVPLYHPGARARIHRSAERQSDDFRALGRFIAAERRGAAA